ncbi:RNA polymerase sigma-70 factor (ECF subfamily) [Streptacidiphilus sp. MAP12-16]|uniref:sigma-70 family RNA polymerase sigma factor n=1 Tax=Streptacidiphilus sp. MAP12-16 TaxID=3156300 RepID=UPI003513727D
MVELRTTVTAEPTPEPTPAPPDALAERLEQHRVELTGYCYRMLGSLFEAEDAVQETMVRAWRGYEGFEGRASLRSWMYRIATNTCLDMAESRARRARPMDLSAPVPSSTPLCAPLPEQIWLGPAPDARVVPESGDPAEIAALRDTVRLAFVAALQHLAPRQRAVLILREVLAWRASEVADLLGTTVASVNSALQRARATLAASGVSGGRTPDRSGAANAARPMDPAQQVLLARYLDAFERYDVDSLTTLLREDAVLSMPPFPLWLRGPADIRGWLLGTGIGCRGSRLVPVAVNGGPGFGQYRSAGPGGGFVPWSLQVIEVSGGLIAGINAFLDTESLFPLFGLPPRLDA